MKFDVIAIDYAWNFRVYNKDTGRGRSAAAHYDTDSLDWEDWRLFVQHLWPLMADNCALTLWMTRPSQDEAMEMVKYDWNAWVAKYIQPSGRTTRFGTALPRKKDRLVYKTELFTLSKNYRDGTPYVGMGFFSRANTEPCMLYVRGRMPRKDAGVRQRIDICPYDVPKDQRHSHKPPEYRRRIERLWPGRRYLEIFARPSSITEEDTNWTFIGNEISGNDIRVDLRLLAEQPEQLTPKEKPDVPIGEDAADGRANLVGDSERLYPYRPTTDFVLVGRTPRQPTSDTLAAGD